MKSSSGINIGNGNNCRENRKTTTTSFSSSPAYINKRVTKTNTVLLKPSNIEQDDDIKRQEQQLNEFIQPSQSFYTTSYSSFQSESVSSKFKFEITPETINHLNQQQVNNHQRRPRIQWITRHASLHARPKVSSANSSVILSSSSIDLNTTTATTTMATDIKKEFLNIPNVSITEMSSKDFNDEYQQQSHIPEEFEQTLNCTSINVVTDDDDDNNNHNNENDKLYIDQASQAIITETKLRKKIKSASIHKKIKSATKRPKPPSATQVTQQTTVLSTSSPTRIPSQPDLTSGTVTKLATITTKIDDSNAGKNMITVDTTKARSNLEVIRLCIRDLGWKEVTK